MAEQEARDQGDTAVASDEESEYGLKDLARLPLLEQVHRLFHAIQHKYPYKETNAWRTLPVEQKKRMLDYIRDKRQRKQDAPPSADQPTEAPAPSVDPQDGGVKPAKSDPYLQMLQRRTLRSSPANEAGGIHPNSAYIAPTQVAEYAESALEAQKRAKARWKLAEAEFYERECVCGTTHKEVTGKRGALLNTISAMMSTFGDADRSCVTAAEEVHSLVGEYIRRGLKTMDAEELEAGSTLRTLVEIFGDEAVYYGRWREFRGETKHEQNELEDVEEEELAEELDLFAVSETEAIFNETFMERIRFADERTKAMDWSIYDLFARGRKMNFMSNKAQQFRDWIGIGKCSRASLEFLNFVAYHNIGRLVELAIKHRTGGQLQVLESSLLKDDLEAVTLAFLPPERLPNLIDNVSRPAKARRVGTNTTPHQSARGKNHIPAVGVTPKQPPVAAATKTDDKVEPPVTLSTTITPGGVSTRPTRLKRLR